MVGPGAEMSITDTPVSRPRYDNEFGVEVLYFRRKVMVPKRSYGEARGGEQPGRPEPKE